MRKRPDEAGLSAADRELMDYTEKLTLRPGEVEREDVEALRRVGFSDRAIVDAALHVALFSFMNRIVDGLGGALDGDMPGRAREIGLPLHPGTFEHLLP